MEHRAYPKIPQQRDGSGAAPGGVWVATEKIHGAHLVVASDGREVAIGKRKRWLAPDEAFFGWQLLRGDLVAAARGVHAALAAQGVVRLFGELFGGGYPHPDVAPTPGLSPVQTGIWYAPDLRFALFDVAIADGAGEAFVSHDEVAALGAAVGLGVVPLLGRGPRAALERLPVRFASRVPAALGLPPLAGNDAEGFVLKPDRRAPVAERHVTKWKIPELDDACFLGSAPYAAEGLLDARELEQLAAPLLGPARLASARSRAGDAPEEVCEEIVIDVLADLEAAFPRALAALGADDLERLRERLGERARSLHDQHGA